MSQSPVIKTTALSYQYAKNLKTLSGINLQVNKGSIYGFLGPNGSGKTTTLSLLLGLLKENSGTIEIFGQDIRLNRTGTLNKIGSLIESPSLYGHLSAKENLEVYKAIYRVTTGRVREVLKMVGLQYAGNKTVKKFSLGMKQRLSIALALLPNPELLILDEPANGLDPNGIIELRELIKKLNREEGMTILISSHILTEVEKMVTHVGIINKGELLFQGSLKELQLFQQKDNWLQIHTSDNKAAFHVLQNFRPQKRDETFSLLFEDIGQVAAINRLLIHHELDVYLLQPQVKNLEQIFIHLTSGHL